jgi:hypothetical protein
MGYMDDLRKFVANKTGARGRNRQNLEDSYERMSNIGYHQLMGHPSEEMNITDLIKERNRFNKLVRQEERMIGDDIAGPISTENLYRHYEEDFWPQFRSGQTQPSVLDNYLQRGRDFISKVYPYTPAGATYNMLSEGTPFKRSMQGDFDWMPSGEEFIEGVAYSNPYTSVAKGVYDWWNKEEE